MIASLRRRHRWMAPGAFGLGAVVMLAGLVARPGVASTPTELETSKMRPVVIERAEEGFILRFRPNEPAPDLLAYEVRDALKSGDSLPADARLIGALAPHASGALAVGSRGVPATVAIYSLGLGVVVMSTDIDMPEEDR